MKPAAAMQPTESDSLLPKPVGSSREEPPRIGTTRIRLILCGSILLSVAATIGFIFHEHNHYNPKSQLNQLNSLTSASLDSLLFDLPDSLHDIPLLQRFFPSKQQPQQKNTNEHGKLSIITGKDVNPQVYHCTSTLMIMRHCDKGVPIKKHGLTRIIDPQDRDGNVHCNAKGVERSNYIASLFVEQAAYEKLVSKSLGRSHITSSSAIPPVPMVSSSLRKNTKVGYNPSKRKPQFPTPQKLYAMNDVRVHKRGKVVHSNFREAETMTPLAEKFGLDVDDRFGLHQEGELARDYFDRLSESVLSSVDWLSRSKDATAEEPSANGLCNNGLTVVNWKHSAIPSLARALGCGRDEGCPTKYYKKDFDTMWMVTFQYSMKLNRHGMPEFLEMEGSPRSRRGRKSEHGSWKISAQLINEGFDPVFK